MAESAATYVSVLQTSEDSVIDLTVDELGDSAYLGLPTAFSLKKFVPLLTERIHVINPFTRQFLVSWIVLLDGIPDLELVTFLPAFLGGLFNFLSDQNPDVHAATEVCLEGFLSEIKRIARLKRGIAESRKTRADKTSRSRTMSESGSIATDDGSRPKQERSYSGDTSHESTGAANDSYDNTADGSWVPGQDVVVDHTKLLEILMPFLESARKL